STGGIRAAQVKPGQMDPSGTVKEGMVGEVRKVVPEPSDADFDKGMAATLRELAAKGLTSVHTMDTGRAFRSLQRLHAAGRLPIRVTWNLPAAELGAAERIGLRSGWGDSMLRIW